MSASLAACGALSPLGTERTEAPVRAVAPANVEDGYLYVTGIAAIESTDPQALEASRSAAEADARLKLTRMGTVDSGKRRFHSVLEQAVREGVSAKLNLESWPKSEVEVWRSEAQGGKMRVVLRVFKPAVTMRLQARMQEIETHLSRYRYVGENSSHLQQLKVLLPTLPWIEEYQRLELMQAGLQDSERALSVKEAGLVAGLSRKISILFNQLLLVVKENASESETYEGLLVQALRDRGLQIGAKQPDLDLNYYIEPSEPNTGSESAKLFADISLMDSDKRPFLSYATEISGADSWTEEQLNEAMRQLADEVFSILRNRMVELVYSDENLPDFPV